MIGAGADVYRNIVVAVFPDYEPKKLNAAITW